MMVTAARTPKAVTASNPHAERNRRGSSQKQQGKITGQGVMFRRERQRLRGSALTGFRDATRSRTKRQQVGGRPLALFDVGGSHSG